MGKNTKAQDEDFEEDFNTIEPSILERLRAIMLAFDVGIPEEQAAVLIEELRGWPDVVRVDQSDEAEAELMLWFRRGFSVPREDKCSLIITSDRGIPTVEYLRRTAGGIWRFWYPGTPWDEA